MLAPAIISVLPYVPHPPHYWQNRKCFSAVITVLKHCTVLIESGLGDWQGERRGVREHGHTPCPGSFVSFLPGQERYPPEA